MLTWRLLLMQPLFPGESGVDQLVEIIKVGFAFYTLFHAVDWLCGVEWLYVLLSVCRCS